MMSDKYNAIIIGAGQAGVPIATSFSKSGKRVALVEREHVGGTCINEGCTPTKTMIASGRAAHIAARAPEYGVINDKETNGTPLTKINMQVVRKRKRDIVSQFRAGSERRLSEAGVELVLGEASFLSKNEIRVQATDTGEIKIISSNLIFINTGERPVKTQIPGAEDIPILNSTTVMELGDVPDHLVVIGGGYVGVEFGQLFKRLGAGVTIIQRGSQLLPREDRDIAAEVLKILQEDGIRVMLRAEIVSVAHLHTEAIQVVVNDNGETHHLTCSHLLAAAGREPNTDMLNLRAAGVKTNSRGYIEVSPTLETNIPGIYALGDVKGPPAFTHISYDDFRIVQANLLDPSGKKMTTDDRLVPYTVFMDPQLGHVGLHEKDALKEGRKIKVASMPMSYVARALEVDESRGMMKAVVDAATDQIIGFTILGIEGGEVMNIVQMAMMGKLKWQVLQDTIFSHPTLGESLNNIWGFLRDVE